MTNYQKFPSKNGIEDWLEYYHDPDMNGVNTCPVGSHVNRNQKQARIPVSESVSGEDSYTGKYFKAFELSDSELADPKKPNLGLYLTDAHFNWDHFFDSENMIVHPGSGSRIYANPDSSAVVKSPSGSYTVNYFWKKIQTDSADMLLGMYTRYKSCTNGDYTLDWPDTEYNYRYGSISDSRYDLLYNQIDEHNDGVTGSNNAAASMYYDGSAKYTDYFDRNGNLRIRVTVEDGVQDLYVYYTDSSVAEPKVCIHSRYSNGWSYSLHRYALDNDLDNNKLLSMSFNSTSGIVSSSMDFIAVSGNGEKKNQETYPGSKTYNDALYLGGTNACALVSDEILQEAINIMMK